MPGLYGIISSNPLSVDKIKHNINKVFCDNIQPHNDWDFSTENKQVLLGWRANRNHNISDFCTETDDITISISGWISTVSESRNLAKKVIILYRKYGEDLCKYLRGHFCIALWDKKKEILILFSDHFGLRPHYWCKNKTVFSFSYEVGALIAINGLGEKLDLTTLSQFLSYEYILQDRTWHPDVSLLPPGSALVVSRNAEYTIRKYWSWEDIENRQNKSSKLSNILEECRHTFNKAVRNCYSDATSNKILITLSGGLDTRALISAADLTRTETITHGLENCANRVIGKDISDYLDVKHYEFDLDPKWLPDRGKHIVGLTSGHESLRHTHSHSYYKCFEKISNNVIIGGLGGEYVRAFFYNFGKISEFTKPLMNTNHSAKYNCLAYLLHLRMTYKGLSENDKNNLVKPDVYNEIYKYDFLSVLEIIRGYQWWADIFKQLDRFYMEQRVRRFIINGQLYTWNHLESRWPFMDLDFITAANDLPDKFKIGSRFHRYLIAKNNPGLLDIPLDATLKPIKKRPGNLYYLSKLFNNKAISLGYNRYTNYEQWFKNDWKMWIEDTLINQNALCNQYLNQKEIKNIWHKHLIGHNNEKLLSILITIELWLKVQKDMCRKAISI